MSRRWLRRPSRRRTEQGYAAILVAAFTAAVVLPLCALSVDIARMYVEIERVQNAADAAAMAGVTYLPDDLPSATTTAKAASARNGYPDSGSTKVTVTTGTKPTQLKVTVASTIKNSFASAFGFPTVTVSRSAVSDYNGPAPMGSPCNAFGNEPTPGAAEVASPGSQIVTPLGGAPCTSNPKFWAAIAGPETPKGNGDAIMTRTCSSGNDGCTGTTNNQFDPLGYFYLVRVAAAAVNQPVTLQIYDPAFVENGDKCEVAPDDTGVADTKLRDNMNTYTADGLTRYKKNQDSGFCTGDVLTSNGSVAPVTSFGLRAPTDTYRPVNGAPITGCEKQYKGYREDESSSGGATNALTSAQLRQLKDDGTANSPSYRADVAQLYHQWVNFCTFTPTRAGDYYLQVRTNVAIGGSADATGAFAGNMNVFSQAGDDTSVKGNGNNRFALRVTGTSRASVSVAAWENMGIYANATGASSEFNLVRVIPAAASKTLIISFFDVGDADTAGKITVLPPVDSNLPTPVTGCTGSGVLNGNLTNCEITPVGGTAWNGKAQTIRVPIPNTYTCTSTQTGGCWFRLQVSFPSGVADTTTWSAKVEGDPVRLIE
jgi:Flp pilus assembly protein TadG